MDGVHCSIFCCYCYCLVDMKEPGKNAEWTYRSCRDIQIFKHEPLLPKSIFLFAELAYLQMRKRIYYENKDKSQKTSLQNSYVNFSSLIHVIIIVPFFVVFTIVVFSHHSVSMCLILGTGLKALYNLASSFHKTDSVIHRDWSTDMLSWVQRMSQHSNPSLHIALTVISITYKINIIIQIYQKLDHSQSSFSIRYLPTLQLPQLG